MAKTIRIRQVVPPHEHAYRAKTMTVSYSYSDHKIYLDLYQCDCGELDVFNSATGAIGRLARQSIGITYRDQSWTITNV